MSKLTISEALTRLEDGKWHSVAYVKADLNKKAGGQIIRIKECRMQKEHNATSVSEGQMSGNESMKKSQRHSLHATRNLQLRNGLFRKMHIYTLFTVDQLPVL